MVKLIIDIPKEDYDIIKNDMLYSTFSAEMKRWGIEAIRNGKLIEEKDCDMKELTYADIPKPQTVTMELSSADILVLEEITGEQIKTKEQAIHALKVAMINAD